jgi:hypothetical protein
LLFACIEARLQLLHSLFAGFELVEQLGNGFFAGVEFITFFLECRVEFFALGHAAALDAVQLVAQFGVTFFEIGIFLAQRGRFFFATLGFERQ